MSTELKYASNSSELNEFRYENFDNEKSTENISYHEDEGDNFLKELFKIYDTEQLGFITIETFITISKENMPENLKNDNEVLWIFYDSNNNCNN